MCEVCEAGHWERSPFAGTPIFVHADGTREVYYECPFEDEDEDDARAESILDPQMDDEGIYAAD